FNGSPNFAPAREALTFSITKAAPTFNIIAPTGSYNGHAHAATGTVTGPDQSVVATLDSTSLTYYAGLSATGTPLAGAPTAAGWDTVVGNFNGNTSLTSGDSKPVNFLIAQATPHVVVNGTGATVQASDQPYIPQATVAGVVPGVDDTPAASLVDSTTS